MSDRWRARQPPGRQEADAVIGDRGSRRFFSHRQIAEFEDIALTVCAVAQDTTGAP